MSINQLKKAERNIVLSAEARRILSILADTPTDAIAADENGRPFFHDDNVDFSISHSGSAVAVSLVSEGSRTFDESRQKIQSKNIHRVNIRTGCDIQLIRPRKNLRNIAEENFSAAEKDYIFSQGEKQFECARFFQIWTLKECFIKLRGLSVFDMPKVPSFISGRWESHINDALSFEPGAGYDAADRNLFAFYAGSSSPLTLYLYELVYAGECYMLATAIEGSADKDHDWDIHPEIRLFSQSEGSLDLRRVALFYNVC